MIFIIFKRICVGERKLGQWRKKCVIVSLSLPQSNNGFTNIFKAAWNLWFDKSLNLRSQRWLRPTHNLVRSLIPYGLWISQILFDLDRTQFRRFFFKIKRLWVSHFPIKFVPLRYSRRKEWVLEIIVLHELQEHYCHVWFHGPYSS